MSAKIVRVVDVHIVCHLKASAQVEGAWGQLLMRTSGPKKQQGTIDRENYIMGPLSLRQGSFSGYGYIRSPDVDILEYNY